MVEAVPAGQPALSAAISVCHIASGDRWAGAEAQVATLLRSLARRQGIELRLAVLNEGRLADEARAAGVAVRVFPEAEMSFLQIARALTGWLRGSGVQVLHSHRYKENLLATLIAKRCEIPVQVRTQHGLPEPFSGWSQSRQRILQALDAFSGRRYADAVISVSRQMRQPLGRRLGEGKIAVIPNGIDAEQTRCDLTQAEARGTLGLPLDALLIGAGGRLEPVKRLDLFLCAMAEAMRSQGSVQPIIVGEGSDEARLRRLADELGIGERVQFLGQRPDMPVVLRALDFFCLTSDHEGMPMVLLECLAVGVPVVARAVGGIPELVRDGREGLLVESSDPQAFAAACLRLAQDSFRRQEMGRQARERAREQGSAEQNAERTLELYRSLLAAESGARA